MAMKKATTKKTMARKATAKGKSKVGQGLACSVCGLSVTVDEDCGCVESHDIFCCGTPMQKKRPRR
jgi:hypothetical protein